MTIDRDRNTLHALLVLAFATDLLSPILIEKGILPSATRWISPAAVALMIALTLVRMLAWDRIPGAVWIIIWFSLIGACVALVRGQGAMATAWGWWRMFEYPLVGLFAFLQPNWPRRFPEWLSTSCVVILGVEVIVQIGQYFSGQKPGDLLAGTFGAYGTHNLMLFAVIAFCLALGHWLVEGKWMPLALVMALSLVSNVLAENKVFPVVVVSLSILTGVVAVVRNRDALRPTLYLVSLGLAIWCFALVYNAIIPTARTDSLESYLQIAKIKAYSDSVRSSVHLGQGYSDIGRNYAVIYGLNAISTDTTTLLFGMGLGTRSESRSLGITGSALGQDALGLSTGTSLLIIMQELGLVGLGVLGGFVLWVVLTLAKDIIGDPCEELVELRYALLLFTLLWPLWIWYAASWFAPFPMLLYWTALGYALREGKRQRMGTSSLQVSRQMT